MHSSRLLQVAGCWVLLSPSFHWAAESLSSSIGEVLFRNLQPGTSYHLSSLMSFPLRIRYGGNSPVLLMVEPIVPEPQELKAGYESVPDISWLGIVPSQFDLTGSTIVECNITVSIPEDESLRGRKFQVHIWSRTQGKQEGLGIEVGTKSRFLLSIATQKNDLVQESLQKSYMGFKIDPPTADLKAVPLGRKIRMGKWTGNKFYVRNVGGQRSRFKLEIVRGETLEMDPPNQTEWGPENAEIRIFPETMTLKPGKFRTFDMSIKIPEQPQYRGKKYHYLLRVTPEGTGISSGILFRINVETAL